MWALPCSSCRLLGKARLQIVKNGLDPLDIASSARPGSSAFSTWYLDTGLIGCRPINQPSSDVTGIATTTVSSRTNRLSSYLLVVSSHFYPIDDIA